MTIVENRARRDDIAKERYDSNFNNERTKNENSQEKPGIWTSRSFSNKNTAFIVDSSQDLCAISLDT